MSPKGAAEADAITNISKVGTASVENNMNEHTCDTNNVNSENTSSSAPTETTETRDNWLDALPREALNNIHLPPAIVFHDGLLCSDITDILSLGLDSPEQSSEGMKARRESRHIVLEFTSNTSMLAKLDSLPDNSLASYNKLTITVKGSYNGHAVLYSNYDDCHRTNICPTLRREGDKVWFEVMYPCIDCRNKPFYQREREFACPTILAKFERLTGLAFTAGAVGINTHIHKDGRNVPHVLAYKLAVSISSSKGTIFCYDEKQR